MRYFDTFTGYGGFTLGIQRAYERIQDNTASGRQGKNGSKGLEYNGLVSDFSDKQSKQSPTCIGYSEINKYAIQVYEKHFKHKNYGDITKINPDELPDFDLLTG